MATRSPAARWLARLAWAAAALASAGASAVIWRGPSEPTGSAPTPPPLPRPPTAAERAAVEALADRVLGELQATRRRTGVVPSVASLEGAAPDGDPFLPSGLPDNPLVAGVAGVAPGCAADPPAPAVDWRYCAEPLDFRPAGFDPAAPR